MKFSELVKKRKTAFEYSNRKVAEKDMDLILEAARWAPSCTNSQPWHFIVVRGKKRIEDLMRTVNYGFFHDTPPSVIVACVLLDDKCAGPNYACFRDIETHTHDTFMSVGIAAYNMCLEAEDLGISSSLLTPEPAKVKDILRIKKSDTVPLLVGLGYEKSGAFKRDRVRRELREMLSKEYMGGK